MFYNFVAGLMILIAIISMFILIGKFILYTEDSFEKTMRIISFSGGVLIFAGARGMGINIPEIILSSLDPSGGYIVDFIASVAPAVISSALTFYLFKVIKDNQDKNQLIYFLIILATLIILTFSDLFIQNVFSKESNLGINVAFVIGIILTLVFKVEIFRGIYSFLLENPNINREETSWKDRI
jgi:hypothetical protein